MVGGWSIDLFLGEQTREHEDLEIAIVRPDFPIVRAALAGFVAHDAGSGKVRRLADGEIPQPPNHQCWFLDVDAQLWRVDLMLEPGDHDTWVCRRDGAVSAPRSEMIGRTADGIPYLHPKGALLYKAKAARPKDEADLAAALPRLDDSDRAWLRDALERAHPGNPWLGVV